MPVIIQYLSLHIIGNSPHPFSDYIFYQYRFREMSFKTYSANDLDKLGN